MTATYAIFGGREVTATTRDGAPLTLTPVKVAVTRDHRGQLVRVTVTNQQGHVGYLNPALMPDWLGTVVAPPRAVLCTCGNPARSLLAPTCGAPECVAADIAADLREAACHDFT